MSDTPFRPPLGKWPERARGIPLRAVAPNAVTAMALCFGLSAVRFAIQSQWELAVAAIVFAGVLDGLDGRIARLLRAQSRFGAELDSLSDVIAFGVAPAVVVYLWSLQTLPQFGWTISLSLAVGCALRLARFNANIDVEVQPHKSAGFLTGVPAPAGAGLALLPVYTWLWSGLTVLRSPYLVAPWALVVACLLVSNVATFSWAALRLRRGVRLWALGAIALLGAALASAPWTTLTIISLGYIATIPFGMRSYASVRRMRVAASAAIPAPASIPA